MTDCNYKDDYKNFACSDGAMLEILLISKTARERFSSCNSIDLSIAQEIDMVVRDLQALELRMGDQLSNLGYLGMM